MTTLKNIRLNSDAAMRLSLTIDGVKVDFSNLANIKVFMFSDEQRVITGACQWEIDGTSLNVKAPAILQKYTGAHRVILTCVMDDAKATYDAPAYNVVATSAEVNEQRMTAQEETDPIGIDLMVQDITDSLIRDIIHAALGATEAAVAQTALAEEATDAANAAASRVDGAIESAEQATGAANEAAASANTAAGLVTDALTEYAGKITEQDAAINEAILDQNTTISEAITRQDATISERFDEQDEQIAKKVSYDGKYPELTSGFASQLVGRGESTPSEFSFRASGGKSILDGSARIKELRGNAVVWNQLVNYHSVSSSSNGITAELLADGRVRIYGTATDNVSALYIAYCDSFIVGHKYLLTGPSGVDDKAYVYWYKANVYNSKGTSIVSPTSLKDGNGYVYIRVESGAVVDWTGDIICHDLTKMFGSGYEPTTIEEFYARCPIGVDMKAYNEGEMIADNSKAIKSIGDNAWDEEWRNGYYAGKGIFVPYDTQVCNTNPIEVLPNEQYYINFHPAYIWYYDADMGYLSNSYVGGQRVFTIPSNAKYINVGLEPQYGSTYNHDITISLYHSGWKAEVDNVYKPYQEFTREIDQRILDAFPNGRKPWDKVYNKNGKGYVVKGTGEVDLGTIDWAYNQASDTYPYGFFYKNITNKAQGSNLVCSKYITKAGAFQTDKCIFGSVSNITIYITDSSYTDAATFKEAMQGVTLWYELAEPEIIEYDEPFNLDYEVWDFGTEQAIAEAPSAPINADIIYQFNAVDMIREHESEITALQEQIAALQSAIASLTNGGE